MQERYDQTGDTHAELLVTTTPSLEGRRILKHAGLVTGEAIVGPDAFKDVFASVRHLIGGRAGSDARELQQAKAIALDEMVAQARELGANAVIAVDLDFETISQNTLMVCASGTAVICEDEVAVPAAPSIPDALLAAAQAAAAEQPDDAPLSVRRSP